MINKLSFFNKISLVLGLLFMYLPIILVVIFSFNESRLVSVWSGFSLYWYQHLLNNEDLISAVKNSLSVAIISSTCSVILGMMSGIVLSRFYKFRGYKLFSVLLYVPIILPDIILGIAFLLTFILLKIPIGFYTIILSHTILCSCYVAIIIQSRLSMVDKNLEEAAMDLGYTSVTSFIKVVMPLMIPTIIAAWLICFAISLDDLIITSFNYGLDSVTLPIKLYSQIKLGVTPEINAISTLTLLLIFGTIFIVSILINHKILDSTK